MGAWRFVRERFLDGDVPVGGRVPRYAGRRASASPAAGTLKVHVAEQEALVADALAGRRASASTLERCPGRARERPTRRPEPWASRPRWSS